MEQVFITHTEEQVIKRTTSTTTLPSSLTSIYKDLHRYASLLSPGSGIEFLLYLLTKMDSSNTVTVNSQMIRAYSDSLPSTPTTERTFFRLLKNLVNNGALAKQSRGVYLIQPSVIHGRLGIPLEMPSILPLEDKKEYVAPVLRTDFVEFAKEVVDTPKPKRTSGLVTFEDFGDFQVMNSTKPEEVVPMPEAIEEMLLPDTSTHTMVMNIEEAKELYPDKAEELDKLTASMFDHGPGGIGDSGQYEKKVLSKIDKPLMLDDIKLPVVEEKKQPKLNLSGGTKFRV